MLEALRTDKVSRLWNSQGQVLGGGTPRLLLMAPSDASTSHLDWCKLPLGVQDNHSPQNSEVTHKTRRSAGCSSVGGLSALLSFGSSFQGQGWRMEWGWAWPEASRRTGVQGPAS